MRILKKIVAVSMLLQTLPCFASDGLNTSAQPFGEVCEGPDVSHPKASWLCTGRDYRSADVLISDLKNRSPREQWEVGNQDPVLAKVQDKPVWWDCKPQIEACGYWIQIAPQQFILLQQLLDYGQGNKWLGIGITTYCGGNKEVCRKLAEQAATVINPDVNFGVFGGRIGPAPPAPPLPPPPPLGK